jgi:hypothetical protein
VSVWDYINISLFTSSHRERTKVCNVDAVTITRIGGRGRPRKSISKTYLQDALGPGRNISARKLAKRLVFTGIPSQITHWCTRSNDRNFHRLAIWILTRLWRISNWNTQALASDTYVDASSYLISESRRNV